MTDAAHNKDAADEFVIPGLVHIICVCCDEATVPYAKVTTGALTGRWCCKPCCEDAKPCCAEGLYADSSETDVVIAYDVAGPVWGPDSY